MAFVSSFGGVKAGNRRSVAFFGGNVGGARTAATTTRWSMASVLIVNAPSGGHGFIGYHLADQLTAAGNEVCLFTVGEEEKVVKKEPCKSFGDLTAKGVKTAYGDSTSADAGSAIDASFDGKKFDVIIENFSKSADDISPVVKYAVDNGVGQFLYVSSCGIYKKSDEVPLHVGDAVNEKAGQVAVESLLASSGLNYSAFRPIYIIGPKSSKADYVDYFFHRIVRGRPVLLPGSGDQMTSVTHVGDVASMIASAVGNENAKNEIFNVVSPRFVSHVGVANLCAKAAGKEVEIKNFDPSKLETELKKFFPFRNQHFFASPTKAMDLLGWESTHGLEEALAEAYSAFIAKGGDTADIDFSVDDQLLSSM